MGGWHMPELLLSRRALLMAPVLAVMPSPAIARRRRRMRNWHLMMPHNTPLTRNLIIVIVLAVSTAAVVASFLSDRGGKRRDHRRGGHIRRSQIWGDRGATNMTINARSSNWRWQLPIVCFIGAGVATYFISQGVPAMSLPNAVNPSCRVKGNISISGQRIYHVPGQEYYGETRIDARHGERWFCSELEAREAGWRRAMQ